MLKLSRLYGIDIYTDKGAFLGKVHDVILNMESGEIVRLTTEPLRDITKEEARDVLKNKSLLYKNVQNASDIIIVSKRTNSGLAEDVEGVLPAGKPIPRGALHTLSRRS